MSSRLTVPAPPALAAPLLAGPRRGVGRPIAVACIAFLILYARSMLAPVLFYDDFQILVQSWTWQRTCEGLWVPQNEHAMPLGRLFCFGLASLANRLPVLPFLTCLVGPLALLAGMGMVYALVRRETGHPLYALLALVLFGVTTVYCQVVWWFAAAFAILALDTTLLGLLAAQRWRQTGRGVYLCLTLLACALAPGWFAIGVLAGPLCCLYLLRSRPLRRTWIVTLLPLLGTALFLAISLPLTKDAIMHLDHYGGQTALEAFHPLIGLEYTARSIADNLLLGLGGVCGVDLPVWCVAVVLAAAAAAGVWWWRQAPDRRLMLLGLGLIGSSYLLVYSARSTWPYADMTQPMFARYHLLPQLGLALFFCGGLPGRAGRWFALDADGTLSGRQRRFVYILIAACLLVQLPRGILCGSPTDWHPIAVVREQQNVLRRIEDVDARCREHHISATAAREALGRLEVPCSAGVIDGWEFLRGSDDPRQMEAEEVKRLLETP